MSLDDSPHQGRNGSEPERPQSRFFRNWARRVSFLLLVLAIGALVAGGVLSETRANGSPTSAETDVVRWVIVGSVVGAALFYVIGGRIVNSQD